MTHQSLEQHARDLLAEVYRPDGVDIWLTGAKRFFNGERPIDLIERGEGARVLTRIQQLADGNF